MKKVKTTSKYIYVSLGDKDMDEVWTSSDLIRVERENLKYKTLSDAVKCDNEFEEIDYPFDWVIKDERYIIDVYKFKLPDNVDDIIDENPKMIR